MKLSALFYPPSKVIRSIMEVSRGLHLCPGPGASPRAVVDSKLRPKWKQVSNPGNTGHVVFSGRI